MKIAFASTNGKMVNRKFGEANNFQIWEIQPDRAVPRGSIGAIDSNRDKDTRNTARADAIAGCTIVCSMDISTPALAKIVARRIFHLKTVNEASIEEIINKIQGTMRHNPPPWLRKAMQVEPGKAPELEKVAAT